MTVEEKLAEEYASSSTSDRGYYYEGLKDGFLAGLKTGKEKAKKEIEEELLKCYQGYTEKEE